jgi:hypothetical protein
VCLIRVSHINAAEREECVYLHSNAAKRVSHTCVSYVCLIRVSHTIFILMLPRECLIRVSHTCVSYDLHSNAAEREKILMLLRERSGSLSHSQLVAA